MTCRHSKKKKEKKKGWRWLFWIFGCLFPLQKLHLLCRGFFSSLDFFVMCASCFFCFFFKTDVYLLGVFSIWNFISRTFKVTENIHSVNVSSGSQTFRKTYSKQPCSQIYFYNTIHTEVKSVRSTWKKQTTQKCKHTVYRLLRKQWCFLQLLTDGRVVTE